MSASARRPWLPRAEDENPGAGRLEMPILWPARSTPDPSHNSEKPVGGGRRRKSHCPVQQLSPLLPFERHLTHGAHKTLRTPALLWTVPSENLEMSERHGNYTFFHNSPPMLISLTTLFATLPSIFRSRPLLEP